MDNEFVTCINNDNWFGTVGKKYEVIAEGTRVLHDISFENGYTILEFIEVVDDCDQLVEIDNRNFSRD